MLLLRNFFVNVLENFLGLFCNIVPHATIKFIRITVVLYYNKRKTPERFIMITMIS